MRPLTGPVPPFWTRSSINGIDDWVNVDQATDTETIDLPAEGVQLWAQGDGRRILETVGYSSLHAVLALSNPVEAPASWKTVHFDGLQAKVPASWPVEVVTDHQVKPAACSPEVFYTPQVYLGDSGVIPACPMTFGRLEPAIDGLWIRSGSLGTAGGTAQAFSTGSVTAHLTYSDTNSSGSFSAQVDLTKGPVSVTIGLGTDPTTAEEILSSFQSSNLPNTPDTPTTISPTETTNTAPADNQRPTTS